MGYFKKFTDFCCGFAAFSAIVYLLREFMAYSPKEVESTLEKLKMFLSTSPSKDYRLYPPLIGLMLLSLTVSLTLRKFPSLPFAVSILPLLRIIFMYNDEKLYERPMLYVILCALHCLGCFLACVQRDRADRRRRSAFGADLVGLMLCGFCLYLLRFAPTVSAIDLFELTPFQKPIYFGLEGADLTVFRTIAAAVGATVLLRWLLRDLYYLDALCAVAFSAYGIYLWNSDRIPFHGDILVTFAVIYAAARLIVMLSCKPKSAYDLSA